MGPTLRSLLLLLTCVVALRAADDGALAIGFGADGLSSLTWRGEQFLHAGAIGATWNDEIVLRHPDGKLAPADLKAGTVRVDAEHRSVERAYPWGALRCVYTVAGERLILDLTLSSSGDEGIAWAQLQVMELQFPSAIAEYDGSTPLLASNLGGPTVIGASHAHGALAVCNEDLERPLSVGFPWASDRPTSRIFPLWADTGHRSMIPESHPTIARPIAPGCSDHYRLSLRFGAAGSTPTALAADLYQRYAAAHPATLAWTDRRPIGMIMLSSSVPHPPGNPRGWFANDPSIDTASEAGRAAFATRLMRYADDSIRVLKDMDAQGAVIWDCEGQEFPHATSFIGDPRCLPPEMAPLADAFFKRFADAGLRTGVCVRPQRAVAAAYGGGVEQLDPPADQLAAVIGDKLAYARKRWGCSLFYLDSNVVRDERSMQPIDAAVIRQIALRVPDALLIPEHASTAYWGCSAPYRELRGGWTATPGGARLPYAQAFSVICTNDGPLDQKRTELVDAVRHGDVLMFRGWYDDPANAKIKAIYAEAKR